MSIEDEEFSAMLRNLDRLVSCDCGCFSKAASKEVVIELPEIILSDPLSDHNQCCSICLKEFDVGENAKELPCSHQFHTTCITPWLEKVNTCPECRSELPTDKDFKEFKRDMKFFLLRERFTALEDDGFCKTVASFLVI